VASREKDVLSLVVSLTRVSDGSKTPSLVWSAPSTPELPLWLARAVFLLWSSFHGYLADQAAEPPVFVDDLPGSVLNPLMPPMGVAVTSRGTLAVALIMSCLELDHTYRQVGEPAKSLGDKGVQLYAGSVAATPAGSLLLKPTMGRDLYRVQPNALEAQKIPTGLELSLIYYWTALPDGSALLVDATNRKAYKAAPGKRRQELPLFPNPSSWPTAYAAGPDGSIWVYDPQLRGVRIFTAEGTPLDIVLPLTDPATVLSPAAMAVGPDGSFVLLSNNALYRFRPDGRLAWAMATLAGSEQSALPASASIAIDWSRGLIYLCDLSSRRITKILDRAWCRENGIRNDFEEKVIALRAGKPGDEAGTLARTAKLYESVGSTLMAKAYWQKVEDADPGNPDADARLQAIEVEELRAAAHDLDDKARAARAAIGIETARPWSIQAIQKYELLLSKAPDDEKSRAAMEDLRKLFSQAAPEPEKKKPLSITEFHLVNLFPSLMHWYALHPPGTVTVTNSLPDAVRKVRASLFIPGYMELPFETTSPVDLGPGKSATFSLSPVFKQDVLANNQEDMTVQAQVTVTWTVGAEEQTASRVGSATIYRNTALTWDDTRKISSYITPNEATVSGFAARALSGGTPPGDRLRLSRSLLQAIRICDAVGAYGITYVQNLDAPFSKALGKAEIIDAVHFPRITLQNRTGDCSDTTALLCSLLESVGIRTAAITTPGHIFAAFDTDEPAENAQYFRGGSLEAIAKNGKVWIPIETTILSQGFMAAWASASELVKKYSSPGPYEFIPVAAMRDAYPALPLPRETLQIAEPAVPRVDAAFTASLSGLTDSLYVSRLKTMDAALASLSGRQAVKARVQQGILHAMFGRLKEAEDTFRKAIADDPALVSPYVNLANVKLLGNDDKGALQIVKQGLARNADSALLNLLAARIYSAGGDSASAEVYLARVKKTDPELATRFAELARPAAAPAGGSQRSAEAGTRPVLIWGDQ
jgi:tetratricopeptide (TPR) repeat protein